MTSINKSIRSRKCVFCQMPIFLDRNNLDDIVLYKNEYYHKQHFLDMCNEKINSPRTKKIKWQELIEDVNKYAKDARDKTSDFLDKDEVYKFILDTYDMTIVPANIFHKLAAIYSGSFKGMSINIPPCDLLDMWKRKINFLNKLYEKRKSTGNVMDKAGRVNYDLSVLINKYDSYLEWKEQQEILEKSSQQQSSQNIIEYSIVKMKSVDGTENNSNKEMSDLVDDIFT